MNVLITGANRGIGLGFVEHYLKQGWQVWACYRDDMLALKALTSEKLHLVQWNVTEQRPQQGELPTQLDLLINNAGIYGPSKQAGQDFSSITPETMMEVFRVDCVGVLQVTQTLRAALSKTQGRIANISSKMGSSADNSSGSCYAYRAAKASLIIISKSMAIDLLDEGIKVVTLHPGWVQTDMTQHGGEITVETSVNGMCKVIENIGTYPLGSLIAYDGEVIPF